MSSNFGLKSFFNMTTLFAWIVFVMQFALLASEYSVSSLSIFPEWLSSSESGAEMLIVVLAFVAVYVVSKIFSIINLIIVRVAAKFSKKDSNERAKFVQTEDYHTPYPLNFIWVVLATGLTVWFFFMIDPYAGWGADPELTSFFVPGDFAAYLITILALYRIFSKSWSSNFVKLMFVKNFAKEEPASVDFINVVAHSTNEDN